MKQVKMWIEGCARVALAGAVLAVGLGASVQAQDKEKQDLEYRRIDRAMQFELDREPPQELQRMAATPCVAGLAGVYPCEKVDLLSFLPLSAIGGGSGNDIWGWTDPLNGREYAIMGRSSGTSFVDISDPENPVYLGNLTGRGSPSSWRDVKVHANHAYIVSESFNHGMQVFDLTNLRNVVSPPVTFSETAHYDDFGSAHNVVINEETGFAYAVGTTTCSGGPHFVDLANPAAPVFAGCHIETIYTHDTQCVIYQGADTDYQGREVCFNSNENKINIIDVTDHAASVLIESISYSGVAYTHQGWLTEDHNYWIQGDELDEQGQGHNTRTRIFDVRDLDNPSLIGVYDGTTAAIDHNMYTLNGYLYQSNYRAGLQIFDLSDIANGNLTEVARFDIYPSSDSANFNGTWSNYPYYESGVVAVSGIEQGLFIVRPLLEPEFDLSLSSNSLAICDPGSAALDVDVIARNEYVGNVTLSMSGLPGGAVETFGTNPVAAPGISSLTIDTSVVAPGAYSLTVSGTDGVITKDKSLSLLIADSVAGLPSGLLPVDGTTDVSRTPTLSWTAGAQADTYTVDVSTDPGFGSLVFSGATAATSIDVDTPLSSMTTYYWRVRATNACGTSVYTATQNFTTIELPRILLVDDDDNGPDVRATYIATLDALGEDYDVWDTVNTDDEPTVGVLDPYEIVIWFTGDEFGGTAGPGGGGESALASWLDQSACVLMSSQDYYYDRGLTGFMQSHLGLASAQSDTTQTSVLGQGSVFGALASSTLSFPYSNYTDDVVPDGTAEGAFQGSNGNLTGINKDTGVYRTSFWSFGLEAIGTPTEREAALSTFLGWCDALPTLDGDSDSTVNGEDCAPDDGTVWNVPGAASDLRLGDGTLDTLNWVAPSSLGGTNTSYDVLRSVAPGDFASSTCVEVDDLDTTATDASVPAADGLYCYLIRVENACGGNMGAGSASPRGGATCP